MGGDVAPPPQSRRRATTCMATTDKPCPREEAPVTATLDLPDAPEAGPDAVPALARKRGGGPRTEEGKMASRRNAMTHGMRAKVLLPDDLVEAVAARTAELADQFAPANTYEN